NSTEMKSSSQESVTNSSQHSLLHPAIRRCIIYDRTFNKSSAPKDKPRTIPARVFSTTAAEDDQVVPTAQENVIFLLFIIIDATGCHAKSASECAST
ncbi:hypothetical protein Tcan_02143, partial [Toxocara canis]